MAKKIVFWGGALLLICLIAIAMRDKPAAEQEQNPDPAEAALSDLHDIMTDRIAVSVNQMEKLLHDPKLTKKERADEQKLKALEIANEAVELQKAIDLVIELRPKLPPEDADDPRFAKLAMKLKAQAGKLETLARDGRVYELTPAHEKMKTTCNACHELFRGY